MYICETLNQKWERGGGGGGGWGGHLLGAGNFPCYVCIKLPDPYAELWDKVGRQVLAIEWVLTRHFTILETEANHNSKRCRECVCSELMSWEVNLLC